MAASVEGLTLIPQEAFNHLASPFFPEDFCRERFYRCAFLPSVRWKASFATGLLKERDEFDEAETVEEARLEQIRLGTGVAFEVDEEGIGNELLDPLLDGPCRVHDHPAMTQDWRASPPKLRTTRAASRPRHSIDVRDHISLHHAPRRVQRAPALVGGAPFAHRIRVRYSELGNLRAHALQPIKLDRHHVRNVQLVVLHQKRRVVLLRINSTHSVARLEAVRRHEPSEHRFVAYSRVKDELPRICGVDRVRIGFQEAERVFEREFLFSGLLAGFTVLKQLERNRCKSDGLWW